MTSFSRFWRFQNDVIIPIFYSMHILCPNVALSSRIKNLKTHNKQRTRISRWLGQENEENVARTRNYCGWPSSPLLTTYKHGNKENLSISSFFLITCKLVIWKKLVRSLRWRGGVFWRIFTTFLGIFMFLGVGGLLALISALLEFFCSSVTKVRWYLNKE